MNAPRKGESCMLGWNFGLIGSANSRKDAKIACVDESTLGDGVPKINTKTSILNFIINHYKSIISYIYI